MKIAGIGPGDRVLYLGSAEKFMAAAVAHAGAGFIAADGKGGPGSSTSKARADVVLWAMDPQRLPERAEHLRNIRRRLRSGGRLVVWEAPDSDRGDCVNPLYLQQLFDSADFTSIIAGRMVGEWGDMVVATGIKAYAKIRKSGHDHRRKGNRVFGPTAGNGGRSHLENHWVCR